MVELGGILGRGFFEREIGFLNSSLNYAARSDTNDDWIVGRNVVAEQFVDADNASYYVEPAATSHLNDIELYGQIIADGDSDTFINFNAADSLASLFPIQ